MITSKAVYLLLFFLTSTTFGFLENDYRDILSRRNTRGSRDFFRKGHLEQLPIQKDRNNRATEKDRVYENLYDRRSFRTGTERQTRAEDRERFFDSFERNSVERDSIDRSSRLNRDRDSIERSSRLNRDRYSIERSSRLNRDRDSIERSSKLNRDRDSIERSSRLNRDRDSIERSSRLNRDRDSIERSSRLNRDRDYIERSSRLNRDRDSIERSSRLNRDRDYIERSSRLNKDRDSIERSSRLNKDGDSVERSSRLNRERDSIERSSRLYRDGKSQERTRIFQNRRLSSELQLQNRQYERENDKNRFFSDTTRQIRDQTLMENNFNREIRQRRERSLENKDQYQASYNNQRQIREQDLGTRSRSKQERRQQNRILDLEYTRNNLREDSQNYIQHRYRDLDAQLPNRRYARQYRNLLQVNRDQSFGRMLDHQDRNIRQELRRNREETRGQRYIRDFRRYRERISENRDQFQTFDLQLNRNNRPVFRQNQERLQNERNIRGYRQNREHFLETRIPSDERNINFNQEADDFRQYRERLPSQRYGRLGARRMRSFEYGNRIREIPEQSVENRNVEISFRDNPERFSYNSNRDSSGVIKQLRERHAGIYPRQDSIRSRENQRASHIVEANKSIRRFSDQRSERSSNQDRTIRTLLETSISRAGLSRSDSLRQTRDARINFSKQIDSTHDSTSRKNIKGFYNRQVITGSRHIRQQHISPSTAKRIPIESTNVNSIDRQMVPVEEYRSFERIGEVRNVIGGEKIFNFNALINVVQVVLGAYLVGQILTHSSKKHAFGFHRILPSMNSHKQKIE